MGARNPTGRHHATMKAAVRRTVPAHVALNPIRPVWLARKPAANATVSYRSARFRAPSINLLSRSKTTSGFIAGSEAFKRLRFFSTTAGAPFGREREPSYSVSADPESNKPPLGSTLRPPIVFFLSCA